MKSLQKWLFFILQSATLGLAIAFLIVMLRPELLGNVSPANGTASQDSYAGSIARTAPSVVNIHTAKRVTQPVAPFLNDPRLQRYFGNQLPSQSRLETTLGSGVIVSADGYILTNNHVIDGAEAIQIALHDGRIAQAEIVGTDPDTDLALLKAELTELPVIALGRSDTIRVGDIVLAIGNPFGVGQTVTQGIISATGRNYLGHSTFENFIQTDAAINPGNSGGALINTQGELIGVNTAIFSRSGGSNGIGFAIPVNLARGVMEQLIRNGRVIRGWLGVDPENVTPELAEAFGLTDTNGVIVKDVHLGSPAEAAGLQRFDVITHINGQLIHNAREGLSIVASMQPGDALEIKGIRNGQPLTLNATVSERDPNAGLR